MDETARSGWCDSAETARMTYFGIFESKLLSIMVPHISRVSQYVASLNLVIELFRSVLRDMGEKSWFLVIFLKNRFENRKTHQLGGTIVCMRRPQSHRETCCRLSQQGSTAATAAAHTWSLTTRMAAGQRLLLTRSLGQHFL